MAMAPSLRSSKGVKFDESSATFTWTVENNRDVDDVYLQVQTLDPECGWKRMQGYLPLKKVKTVTSRVVQEGEKVTLQFWDAGLHGPLFGGLSDFVEAGSSVLLRLSVYGGRGEQNMAFSEYIPALDLVRASEPHEPQVTAEMVAERAERAHKLEMQKLKRQQREKVKAEQAAKDRVLAEQRRKERTIAHAAERQKEQAEEAAFEADGWRKYEPSLAPDESSSLRKLDSNGGFGVWFWRVAKPGDPSGAKIIFRAGDRHGTPQQISVDATFPEAHLILGTFIWRLCFSLPKHALVDVDALKVEFDGGMCSIVDSDLGDNMVKIKALVGRSYKVPKDAIIGQTDQPTYGVTNLAHFWKSTSSDGTVWPAATHLRHSSAVAPEPTIAMEPPPPNPLDGSEMQIAEVKEERSSLPVSPTLAPGLSHQQEPKPPQFKREFRATDHPVSVLPGIQAALANSGTVRNNKVFVGTSQVADDAGLGLFSAGHIGKNEIISKFDGDPATDKTKKTHIISLESGVNGRKLDCSKICQDFTELQRGMTIGDYHGDVFRPSTACSENYTVGLAAFANSSVDEANCKVHTFPLGQDGLTPEKFLIATRLLLPGEEIVYNYALWPDDEEQGHGHQTQQEQPPQQQEKPQQQASLPPKKRQRTESAEEARQNAGTASAPVTNAVAAPKSAALAPASDAPLDLARFSPAVVAAFGNVVDVLWAEAQAPPTLTVEQILAALPQLNKDDKKRIMLALMD